MGLIYSKIIMNSDNEIENDFVFIDCDDNPDISSIKVRKLFINLKPTDNLTDFNYRLNNKLDKLRFNLDEINNYVYNMICNISTKTIIRLNSVKLNDFNTIDFVNRLKFISDQTKNKLISI